jgi:predicted nucleic acid-binding protein
MPDYVVDASAAVEALTSKTAGAVASLNQIANSTCHAPHLIDAEVGHVLRRAARTNAITDETAHTALLTLNDLIDHRYPHTGRITQLAWNLRHTITFYDALYIALASTLDVPLITADVRLTKAPGLRCQIILVS